MRNLVPSLLAVVLLAGCASTPAPEPAPAADASSAAHAERMLERLKGLEGTWVGSGAEGSVPDAQIRYDVTSGGSAVVETIFPGAAHEMVTVYHLDNGRLVMTHYCAMRNQPFMVARSDTPDDTLHFLCERVGNEASHAAPHMHEGVFTFGDGRLHTEWTMYENLERGGTVVIDLVRGDM